MREYIDKSGFEMKEYEPYEHECEDCQWIGWGREFGHLINKYIHVSKTIPGYISYIERYSSEPKDFTEFRTRADQKGPIQMRATDVVTYGPRPDYQCANCEKDGFEKEMLSWDFSSPEVKFCNEECREAFEKKLEDGELDERV
jgi:hypothetical protein